MFDAEGKSCWEIIGQETLLILHVFVSAWCEPSRVSGAFPL